MYTLLRNFKRRVVRELGGFLVDAGNRILGQKYELMPPTRMVYTGGGDFKAIGFKFFHYFVHYGGLKPEHDVLDVGCGLGRLARPLTKYLTSGSYVGVEIVDTAVDWCSRNISPKYPCFSFRHVDIYNKYYNPKGDIEAKEFRFPFDDSSFDFIISSSVFTHMGIDDMNHYLKESSRVLRPDGVLFSTWYLLNDDSKTLMKNSPRSLQFIHPTDPQNYSFTSDLHIPEEAMAYDESYVLNSLSSLGLKACLPLRYGNWCGRTSFLDHQDIVISKKVT